MTIGRSTAMGAALLLLTLAPAAAQDYPSRSITMVVGFAPGGFADGLARVVGSRLGEKLGHNVIIENRGGAGGNVAAAVVAKAAPDGHTLLVTTTGIGFYEVLTRNRSFALDDLKVVAIPVWAPETMSVHPNNPARALPELIRSAQGRSVNFASPGAGTASHIAAAYFFKTMARMDVVHVPFQGGAPAVNAMLGGHIEVLTGSLPGYAGQLQSGAIRGLAIASEARLPQFPNIPTFAESGFAGFLPSTWVGIFAPGKTSDAIAVKLNTAIGEVLREPAVQEQLKAYFMQLRHTAQPETAAYFKREIDSWRTMINAIGLAAE